MPQTEPNLTQTAGQIQTLSVEGVSFSDAHAKWLAADAAICEEAVELGRAHAQRAFDDFQATQLMLSNTTTRLWAALGMINILSKCMEQVDKHLTELLEAHRSAKETKNDGA